MFQSLQMSLTYDICLLVAGRIMFPDRKLSNREHDRRLTLQLASAQCVISYWLPWHQVSRHNPPLTPYVQAAYIMILQLTEISLTELLLRKTCTHEYQSSCAVLRTKLGCQFLPIFLLG